MNDRITVPGADIEISFKNGHGKTFEEKKKISKGTMYFIMAAFAITSISLMLFMPVKTKISCVYDTDVYDCYVHAQSFLRDLGVNKYSGITRAVLATQQDKNGKMYQVQFVDINNKNVPFHGTWTSMYSDVEKKVAHINRVFFKNKDFRYDFGTEKILMAVMIVFFIVPFFLYWIVKHMLDDYAYEEIKPNRYKAVLKGKTLGNLTQSQVTALTSGMFGHGKEQEKELVDLDEYAVKNAKAYKPKNPKQLSDEELANLQDDELTDMQKDFYDRNN